MDLEPSKDPSGTGQTTANGLVQVEGVVERIVYENEENGFFVARLRPSAGGALVCFVGNLMAVSEGETIRLWGRWADDPRFGRQLRVERYETLLPTSAEAIERYLGSGLIPGIGPTYAKRLVQAFGKETLRVIDEAPRRLVEIDGIGKKRAAQIQKAWDDQKAVRSIMLFLQGHGIGIAHAIKIYKRYGDGAVALLRDNPYRLAEDIAGIAFKTADRIAASLGVAPGAPKRLEAGLLYALDQAQVSGHVFLPEADLRAGGAELLGVAESSLDQPLRTLAAREQIVQEGERCYLRSMHAVETGCADLLRRLLNSRAADVSIDAERAIVWVEKHLDISLSGEQRQALRTAAQAKVMVITGGPGTGKTTVIKSLMEIFERKRLTLQLAAPTGRAAKRMEAATGREARTVHRLLEFSPKEGGFIRKEEYPIDAELLVIDESSMLDAQLTHHLLKAVPRRARVIFVGDVDQLPSVGPGNVLMDIIASERVPTVWLKTIFRQAEQSGIVSNAHRINRGLYPEFNTDDFFFIERKDARHALDTIVELVAERMPAKFGLDPLRDIQVLAPMHRGDAGVSALNSALQEALNPKGTPIPRRTFRQGDKVMQLRNNYELDVFNGDVGIVRSVHEEALEVEVQFDDRRVLYPIDDLDDLGLAYAATIHKSQGSEYPAVIVPVLPQHYMMLQRNVLYTAITRGKRLVVLVGDPKAVAHAVRNTSVTRRHTALAERLRGAAL